jgi:hypothetical protein
VEPVLGFDSDGNDLGRLSLAPAVEDEVCATSVSVVPGGLYENTTAVGVAGFGNGFSALALTTGPFARYETEVGHQCRGRTEATDIADLGKNDAYHRPSINIRPVRTLRTGSCRLRFGSRSSRLRW